MTKALKFRPETLDLFIKLHNLYAEREIIPDYFEMKKLNNQAAITQLEQVLEGHCSLYYDIPWFRAYTYWRCRGPQLVSN